MGESSWRLHALKMWHAHLSSVRQRAVLLGDWRSRSWWCGGCGVALVWLEEDEEENTLNIVPIFPRRPRTSDGDHKDIFYLQSGGHAT